MYEILTHEGRNRIMSASSPTTFVDKYLVQRNNSFSSTKYNAFIQLYYKMSLNTDTNYLGKYRITHETR